MDSAWEQGKLEARKKLKNTAEFLTTGARFIRRSRMGLMTPDNVLSRGSSQFLHFAL